MSPTALFNMSTLAISLLALGISALFAVRQVNTANRANQLPIVIDIYRRMWSPELRNQEELLWRKLPKLAKGVRFSELPKDLREAAYNVCYAYLMVSYLLSLDIIDRRLAILPIHYRITKTWDAVERFVRAERVARGYELSFLNLLESFVNLIRRQDIDQVVESVIRSFD